MDFVFDPSPIAFVRRRGDHALLFEPRERGKYLEFDFDLEGYGGSGR
jgi:hypothetical protein